MADFAAMPFYTDSYLGDCWHLSDAEHGRYLLLLILMWQSPQCRIPNDHDWIARKLKRTLDEVESDLVPLITEFCETDGNWITQKRLQQEFKYVSAKSKTQSERAKSRWEKEKNNARASAGHKPNGGGWHMPKDDPAYAPNPTQPYLVKDKLSIAVDWQEIETKLRKAAGWENEPHPNLHNISPIAALIDAGADLERDIIPIIHAKSSQVRKRSSWKYFVDGIEEAWKVRIKAVSTAPKAETIDTSKWSYETWQDAVAEAKRRDRWPEGYGSPDLIPTDLMDDELKAIIEWHP